MGKSVAEFRRASEDFKRTWEREVSLEEFNSDGSTATPANFPNENSVLNQENDGRTLPPPTLEPVAADQVIPRQPIEVDALHSSDTSGGAADEAEILRKRDWL